MLVRRLAVIVPFLSTLTFGAGGSLLGPVLPKIALEFHLSLTVVGLLFAIMFTGSILAVVVGGYLSDHFGKKPLFLVTLGGLTGAYLLLAMAPSFPILALACLLSGAMAGTIEGLCGAVIADVDPPRVERNMNLLQVAFNVGAVSALLLMARLQLHSANWRSPYLVVAAVAGIILLLGCFMYVPPAPPGEPISLPIARRIFRDRFMLVLALAIALYVASEMSLAWWISPILEGQFRYPTAVAVLAPAVFWFTMGVGRIVSGLLCHHFSGHAVLKVLVIGGVLAYLIFFLPVGPWRLWAGIAAAGFTFSGAWPLIVSLGAGRYPSYSGTSISVLVASGTFGGLFPSVVGYLMRDPHHMTRGLWPMALLYLLLAVLVWGNNPARFPRVLEGGKELVGSDVT